MVIDEDGPRCQGNCPNHGCLEAMASGTALARVARELAAAQPASGLGQALTSGREVSGPLVTELAHDGDPAALEALRIVGRYLGVGLANFANIFNPEVAVIGGGVIAAGELLLGPAREEMLRRALPPSRGQMRIVAARFGHEAGMLGGATLAWEGVEATP
jgi:glucokinase